MRELFRALLKTGSGSLATVLFGVLTVKVLAIRLGPEAVGLFSLTRQMVLIGSALFLTGGQTALVQGLARRQQEDSREFAATAFAFLTYGSVLLAVLFAVTAPLLLPALLGNIRRNFTEAVPLLAVAIALSGPLAYLFGTLNAERKLGRLAIAQALNAATLAILVWAFLPTLRADLQLRFAGVLALAQLPGLMFSAFSVEAGALLPLRRIRLRTVRWFAGFAGTTIAAAALQAATLLALRSVIAERLELQGAGLFDASWSISMVYVMLLLSSFSTYYLPQLAAARACALGTINQVLRMSLFIAVPLISLVMISRPFLLTLLYSREFLAASPMMHWMLLGDFLKVISFVLAMPMLAHADLRAFIIGEAGWNFLMYVGARWVLSRGWGLQGIGIVFALCYAIYLLYTIAYCRAMLGWRLPPDLRITAIAAVLALGAVSGLTWSAAGISLPAVLAAVLGSAVVAFLVFRKAAPPEGLSRASAEVGA